MTELTQPRIVGTAWVAYEGTDPDSGTGYYIEGQACRVEVERSDDNEVAIHIMVGDAESEDAGVYLTDAEAFRLMATLGRTLLDAS